MKLKKISEAMMWLPGFGPGEDPLQLQAAVSNTAFKPQTSLHREVKLASPPKKVWPRLESGLHDALTSRFEKFDANVRAIELVKGLAPGDAVEGEARQVLNSYTGWGGLPWAFATHSNEGGVVDRQRRIQELLSQSELEAARGSTINAHFTPPDIIEALWEGVQQLGFKGGNILEPSAGTGYFIGTMPSEIAERSNVTAIELEPTTARMLEALYGQFGVRVLNTGFEQAKLPSEFYDLVITNVPFGAYQVAELRNVEYRNFLIHDYFIAKALEVTRVGGLVAVITSAGTMDKMSTEVREHLALSARLVSAVRLPAHTFKAIANTSVVADVLIFQKTEAANVERPLWAGKPTRVSAGDPLATDHWAYYGQGAFVNPWYAEHPDCVLGKIGLTSTQHGLAMTVVSDVEPAVELATRMRNLEPGQYVDRRKEAQPREISATTYMVASSEFIKPGAYVINEGKLCISHGSELEVIEETVQKSKGARIRALIPVRDAVRRLVAAQVACTDDGKVEAYRVALNVAYSKMVKKHGFISATMNVRAFRDDPDFPLLLSLEKWDDESQTATKADIFHRRTVGAEIRVDRCETAASALLTCLGEVARVDMRRIGELLERDPEDAAVELLQDGLIYMDPATMTYKEASAYLSGNVREKLAQAESAGEEFIRNVAALREIIPADLAPVDIGARLGSPWVPASDYQKFTEEVIGQEAKVSFNKTVGAWNVSGREWGVDVTQTWGTERVPAFTLMEQALNQQSPNVTDIDPSDPERRRRISNVPETIAAKEKQESIKAAFVDWLWKDKDRADRLVRLYNDEYNSIVERTYDGSHLHLPGFSNAYTLYQHQKDAIWRGIAGGGNVLLAHCVGAGKTLTMICIAMEMRRIGFAKKPVLVVPNHMLEQVAAEFLRAYPGANVLLTSKEDLTAERRSTMLGRIATGDWDAVVMTHSSFQRIELGAEYVTDHIKSVIQKIEASIRIEQSESRSRSVKQLERMKKVWEARLQKKAAGDKDDLLSFDQLGIDAVSTDEAHLFKNLYRHTKMRVAGLPTTDSMRAFDMYLKTRYIMQSRGAENGVIFATGTPVANSVAEMWVMQYYLQPAALQAHGMDSFDTWASNFGEEVTGLELAPDGGSYRLHTRFARFINLPELLAIYKQVADIRTKEQLNLPVPRMNVSTITCDPSDDLLQYVASLVERADKIKSGAVKPWEDNMLAVTTDGRKAATDVRLVGMTADHHGSKVNVAVRNIHRIWEESGSYRGAQVVFLDLSTPSGGGWNLYDDMRGKLIAMGIPADEIAFVHDAKNDKGLAELFKRVREGKVRVIFGSTAKMGVGTNIQTRLVALHDLDAPWRPADVEQRRGRIERQGNSCEVAYVFRYVVARSFDSYTWQLLETKQRFIAQVTSGNATSRVIEDAELTALSFAEVKALATGNPLIVEKAGVDAEVAKLSILKAKHERTAWTNASALGALPGRIAKQRQLVAGYIADADAVRQFMEQPFAMMVGGRRSTDRDEAGAKLLELANEVGVRGSEVVAQMGDLSVVVDGGRNVLEGKGIFLQGHLSHDSVALLKTSRGVLGALEREAMQIAVQRDKAVEKLEQLKRDLDDLRAVCDRPFEQEARLRQLLQRQAEIDTELGTNSSEFAVGGEQELAEAA